jgi:thioredoxin-related protein
MIGWCLSPLFSGVSSANSPDIDSVRVGIWTMNYDKALELSQQTKLPILLNFTGSDWCGWCKLMEKNVFSQEAWQDYASENMILVTIDFPRDQSIVPPKYRERNDQLKNQYGITGYPTYVILDDDGKTILGKLGAGRNKTPESFIKELKTLLKFRDTEIENFAKKLSPEQAQSYRTIITEIKNSRNELSQWLNTYPIRNDENIKKYNDFLTRIAEAEQKLETFEESITEKDTL